MDVIRHDGKPIMHAEMKLLIFHCIDVVERYDLVDPAEPNTLTWEDVRLANIIGARSPRRLWERIVGESLASIPQGLDLIAMPEGDWDTCRRDVTETLQKFINNPGIACAAATKALHRKRPALIPVCDSVLINALTPRANPKKAGTVIHMMEMLRQVGKKNSAVLHAIAEFLAAQNLPGLSDLRMLEALYWMEHTDRYMRLWVSAEHLGWWS